MSAIFGIIDFEGRPIREEWIRSMQHDLAHRGPDRQDIYREDSMFFGHMLLQVTPESIYDASPYEEDGYVITAYARLDEREAIMDRIGTPTRDREYITDPLLLLRSYLKFGKDFVKDIYGDFAFAIWNKKKKELFCARDQMGVKPFLYYFQDNRFVFSTEYKSLVKHALIKTEPDQKYILNEVLFSGNNLEQTSWKNIRRIKPAHHLIVNRGVHEKTRYWKPNYRRSKLYKDPETSARAVEEILKKVVSDRMRVLNQPIGVPLSGGLDSSTISCIAAKKLAPKNKKLITVSSVLGKNYPDPNETDELEYIQEILEQENNIDSSFVYHNEMDFLGNLRTKFNRYFTIHNSFIFVDEALYEKFKSKGVRRIIHGYLGDITVSNKNVKPLAYLLQKGNFPTLLRLGFRFKKEMNLSLIELIKHNIIAPLLPMSVISLYRKLKGKNSNSNLDDFPLKLNPEEKKYFSKKILSYSKNVSLNRLDLTDYFWRTDMDVFEENWDTAPSYYDLEMTYPLTDRRLVECLLNIPIEHFIADGKYRGLLKKAMEGIIPAPILTRNEKGFYAPGHVQVILKDLPKMKSYIELNYSNNNGTNSLIDLKKVIERLGKICENNKKIVKFTNLDWRTIEISTWIYFNLNFKNITNDKKES